MSESHTIDVRLPEVASEKLGFFRYGNLAGKVLLTNDAGEWLFLEAKDFDLFLAGGIDTEHPLFGALQERCFLREGADLDALAERIARKKRFLFNGPHLHIVITTLRCDSSCRYCHASRAGMDRLDTDMSPDTARNVVDHAFQSSSPYLNFEFQGGEPTVNMEVLKFVVDYARKRNADAGKQLEFSLVTGLTSMTEETAEWLIENDILVCTSIDGPEELHNTNRTWTGGASAFATVTRWVEYFNRRWQEMGRDPRLWHVDALMTTTRQTLAMPREVVDTYVKLGMPSIHLRPLNPFGFALASWKKIGYSMEEFLDFYGRALDYIIELNLKGVEILEGTAAIFLHKILSPNDPNFVDIRSPCGAAIGQVTYNHDGKVFPCDEARMVAAMGNELFLLGDVDSNSLDDTLQHPTTRAMSVASLLDGLPMCSTCWNKPYCGVCPMINYMESGDLFGQRPTSSKCIQYMATSRLLLERLADDPDGSLESIFRRWIILRAREVGAST